MEITEYMELNGHEQLSIFTDPKVGLKAFIAIHDTTLGPALGGLRFWKHETEEDSLMDVLRLSRGMTYKSAAAGLNLGGGKALISSSSTHKTESMLRSFGKFVESFGGRYITTEDVGVTTDDIEVISQETSYVTGLPISMGGSGDPSEMTALGIYQGMKACALEVWGEPSLKNSTIAMQGFGKVASCLAKHLLQDNTKIIVTDINKSALQRAQEMGLDFIENPDQIYDVECDVFSPCALGGVINSFTVPKLNCKIVAGSANNQLLDDNHALMLQKRNILYAPDYIINAGGVINISVEMEQDYDSNTAVEKVSRIYDTICSVIETSNIQGITTAAAADVIAENRIKEMKNSGNLL